MSSPVRDVLRPWKLRPRKLRPQKVRPQKLRPQKLHRCVFRTILLKKYACHRRWVVPWQYLDGAMLQPFMPQVCVLKTQIHVLDSRSLETKITHEILDNSPTNLCEARPGDDSCLKVNTSKMLEKCIFVVTHLSPKHGILLAHLNLLLFRALKA